MNKFKSFTVEYIQATDTKPTRCKIANCFDRQTVILQIGKQDNNILDTAKKYFQEKTEIFGYSETSKGYLIFTNWNFKLK